MNLFIYAMYFYNCICIHDTCNNVYKLAVNLELQSLLYGLKMISAEYRIMMPPSFGVLLQQLSPHSKRQARKLEKL